MVHQIISGLAALTAIAIKIASAYDPISIPACIGGLCQDCPTTLVDTLGWPECAVYNTEDAIISRGDNTPGPNGGVELYLDVGAVDEGCAIIIRSPAGTQGEH